MSDKTKLIDSVLVDTIGPLAFEKAKFSEDLFMDGILDSFLLVNLLVSLEEVLGLHLDINALDGTEFRRLEGFYQLVESNRND